MIPFHGKHVLHHGTTVVNWDPESGRSCIVYLRLERSNGTLTWCRPPWSALRAGHSSSQPDYVLSANPEEIVSPGLLLKYSVSPELMGGSPEEGFVEISCLKEVDTGFRDTNYSAVCRRYLLEDPLNPENCVTLVFGANLADNRLMVLVAPPSVAKLWCQGLQAKKLYETFTANEPDDDGGDRGEKETEEDINDPQPGPSNDSPPRKQSFMASKGWFAIFQKHYGLKSVSVYGEAVSADTAAAEEDVNKDFKKIIA
ncbi:hypothetical protein SK128_019554 [Halocaridina rubra]|uniref:HTH CENPB-type domain-containing protein n=1 Tax=Halocaridina rubra TaxID=373956 RepID=A0AAN8WUC0_HALRR